MSRPMKDSGIEWIGEIPQNWSRQKIKYATTVSSGEFISKEEYEDDGQYPIIGANGEIGRTNKCNNQDLVVTTGRVGTIGTAHKTKNAWITDNVLILSKINIDVDFFRYAILNLDYQQLTSGTAMPLITATKFINQFIPISSIPEQLAISAYLDEKCALIDSVIEKTKASIEEYKKLRQAVITQAVTKGIRGNRTMKNSGIAWIGEIPQEWFSIKMKYMMYIRARLGWKGLKADEYVDEGYTFIGTPNIDETGKIDWKNVYYITKERYEESPEIMLSKGDVLLTKDGAGIGKCAYIDVLPTEATTNSSLAVITCNNLLNGKYLFYYFKSYYFQKYIDQLKAGMGVPHLFQGDLREIIIPVPKINEQQEIADYLDKKCAEIDTLITKKEQFLKELESYKKSLIYEYVTGKKEVQA